MTEKKCKTCKATLLGNEKLGQTCNKCLDKAAEKHLLEYGPKPRTQERS